MKFIPCAAMRHANRCNNSDCVFDIIIFWHFRRCPPCTRQPYKNVNRIVIRHCSSPFCFLFLHGWPESNRLACRWGIRTAGNFLTTPAYQNPPRKRGGAVGRPVAVGSAAFCLGNWDRAFLRSRCDVPFSLCRTAMRARFRKYGQVGFSPPYTEG